MIWLMARSQTEISKKPSSGAKTRLPLDTKIILTVPMDTSHMRARKISRGRIAQLKTGFAVYFA
jgi:hypothetical protein